MPIHPTAIIDKKAEIAATADIGPYAIIDGPVKVGEHTRIYHHAYLTGWTEIGDRCEIHPFTSIGHLPQDTNFKGERSYCKIGSGTVLREGVTIHRGTQPESWTTLGENCLLFVYAHVAHNCEVGNNVKIFNSSVLGGHVIVNDNAIISALVSAHQFVRIGEYAMIAGTSRITKDVAPYMKAIGEAVCAGYNSIGLRRSGQFSSEEINDVRQAYRTLFHSGLPMNKAMAKFAEEAKTRTGRRILEFLKTPSRMGNAGGHTRLGRIESSWVETVETESEA